MRSLKVADRASLQGGRILTAVSLLFYAGGCPQAVENPDAPELIKSATDSRLVVTPAELDFGVSDSELVLAIEVADGPFSYAISSDADWVTVDQPNAEVEGAWGWVRVRVDRGELSPGQHAATLTIQSPGRSNQETSISLIVPDADAPSAVSASGDLYASLQRLDFGYQMNTLSFLIDSDRGVPIAYTLSAEDNWVRLSPTSGVIDGDPALIQVDVDRNGLGVGLHSSNLRIETAGGEVHAIEVRAWTADPDGVLPPTLEFDANLLDFGNSATAMSVELRNVGSGVVDYCVTPSEDWITATPAEGDNRGETDVITLTVDRTRLAPGSHACSFQIETDAGPTYRLWVLLYVLERGEPTEAEILTWLQQLEPLQKVHYSWSLRWSQYSEGLSPLLLEYVRITHAVTLAAGWGVNADFIDDMVGVCHEINVDNPAIPARIGLLDQPYYFIFPTDMPPTYTGPECDEELVRFRDNLEDAREWLADANARRGADVEIGAVILNCEIWRRREPGEYNFEAWNAALDAKYDAIYLISKDVFPEARVEWYSRGEIHRGSHWTGYGPSRHFTLNELGDSYGVSLYRLPWPESMRTQYRLTVESALEHGEESVTPWISLASGYKPETQEIDGQFFWMDWDYDLYASWQMGAEVNDPWFEQWPTRFAPWEHADVVIFYPEPFARAPHWGKHFVAYVRGAHGIQELP